MFPVVKSAVFLTLLIAEGWWLLKPGGEVRSKHRCRYVSDPLTMAVDFPGYSAEDVARARNWPKVVTQGIGSYLAIYATDNRLVGVLMS